MERVQQGFTERLFDGHCPVVIIRARVGRSEAEIHAALRAAGAAVSAELGLPEEDIWVQWVQIERGRVFAGGAVR